MTDKKCLGTRIADKTACIMATLLAGIAPPVLFFTWAFSNNPMTFIKTIVGFALVIPAGFFVIFWGFFFFGGKGVDNESE